MKRGLRSNVSSLFVFLFLTVRGSLYQFLDRLELFMPRVAHKFKERHLG